MGTGTTRRDFLKLSGLALAATGFNLPFLSSYAEAQGVQRLVMGTAHATGTWYPVAGAMASTINKHLKQYNVSVVATPNASYENLHRVNKGDFQLGWSDAGSLYSAYHGVGRFKEKFNVLGWMTAHSGFQIIVALTDTGIKRIIDFKGKKVSIGNPGSPSERHAKVIFPAHGLQWNEFQPKYLTADETFGMMKDKLIDGFIYSLGRASSGLMDLVSSRKLNWIPIEKDAAPKILKVFPYYHIGRLNPGDYMLKNPVDMVVWTYQLFCQKNLPERVIYDLTKVTFEHLDEIHPVTADAKEIKLENQLKTMVIPPHPGAKKYFEEKGVKA